MVLGVVLSNRYVARQEKAKRNTAAIEEIYTLMNDIFQDILDIIKEECSERDPFLEEKDRAARVMVLLNLYFPFLKLKTDDYLKNLRDLIRAYRLYCHFIEKDFEDIYLERDLKRVNRLKFAYIEKHTELQQALEKLVR